VTLSYPSELSPESYQDMADRIEILLRSLKRRADAEAMRRRVERDDVADEWKRPPTEAASPNLGFYDVPTYYVMG
jgi:hypothetical protein